MVTATTPSRGQVFVRRSRRDAVTTPGVSRLDHRELAAQLCHHRGHLMMVVPSALAGEPSTSGQATRRGPFAAQSPRRNRSAADLLSTPPVRIVLHIAGTMKAQ